MALKVKLNLSSNAGKTLKSMAGSVTSLGSKFVKFGVLGSVAIAGLSVKLAGDFSKGLAEVSTLMDDLTQGEIKAMGKELKTLAGTTGLALDSLTKAKYDVVSAGFANAAESAMVLNEAAKLAVAGVTTAAAGADILTTSLNAYGKSADEASDVSDILFTTVRLGKTTMTELAASMGQMLPMARAANVSLGDISAALAVVTTNGIKTAEASTAMNAAMQALSAPTDQAKKAMAAAGIEIKTFDDGTTDLVETMRQFEGMDPDELKKFIPSLQAIKAIQILSGDVDGLADSILKMGQRSGAAGIAFDKMNEEWNITMSKLKNNVQNGLIAIGEVIIKKLKPIVDEANKYLQKIGEIGWGEVAKQFSDNWAAILNFLTVIIDKWVQVIRSKFSIMINNIVKDFGTFFKVLLGVSDEWLDEQNTGWEEWGKTQSDHLDLAMQGFKTYVDFLIAEAAKSAAVDPTPSPGGASPSPLDDPASDPRVAHEGEVQYLLRQAKLGALVTERDMFNASALDYANFLEGKAQKFKGWTDQVGAAGEALLELKKQHIANELKADIDKVDEQKAAVAEKLKTDIAAVVASSASEKQKAALISNLESTAAAEQVTHAQTIKDLKQQAVDDEVAFAKKLKPIRVAQAIAGGALMVINALQTKPFVPVGIAAGVLAGVAAAAQIATVIAQPYAAGGRVMPMASGGTIPSSDTVPAMLTPGEIVSTKAAADQFGDEITRMNQLAEGGSGAESAGGQPIIIQTFDSAGLEAYARNQPEDFARAIGFIKQQGYSQ